MAARKAPPARRATRGLVADLNGDGRADLVGWSSLGAAPLTVEMTQPGDNYSAAESSPSLPFDLIYNSADLAAADVDGDGRPEIVVSVSGATYALVVDGTGNVTSTETLSSTNGLSVAPDLDGADVRRIAVWSSTRA